MKIVLRARARIDLDDILAYGVVEHGEEIAERYLATIDAAFGRLADHGRLGSVVVDRPTLRNYPVGVHRIYYSIAANRILIVRILHKAMDVATRL